ncbi:MAG: vWA domain-containing protein [Gammaproteobacteria bacterium]
MKLDVQTDSHLIRAGARSDRYVLIHLTAPLGDRVRERPPVNLGLVLDRSGSMSGTKIQLVRRAAEEVIQALSERDRFSLVVYDNEIEVVAESRHATPEAKRWAVERLRTIDARGTTALAEGWFRGAEQVALHQAPEFINRVLLLTDGLANVGVTDPDELEHRAVGLHRRGIQTTTFGVGADFDEALLERIALAGGGNFYFIEQARQIPDFLTSELGEILEVVARDVAIEVETASGVVVRALSEAREEPRDGAWRFGLGDLVSGQEMEVVLHLNFPLGREGQALDVRISVRYRDGVLNGVLSGGETVSWQYADHAENDRQPRNRVVDRAVAGLYAARARREATQLNRMGRYDEAASLLERVRWRIESYAGDDPELLRIVESLRVDFKVYARPMMPMERKTRYSEASYALRSRDPDGTARRVRQRRNPESPVKSPS